MKHPKGHVPDNLRFAGKDAFDDHHVTGPFAPQTPLGSNTPVRVASPIMKRPKKTFSWRQKFFGWAVDPWRSFQLLIVPLVLYVNWEVVSQFINSDAPNPFAAFLFISNPAPTSTPANPRYAKSYLDLLFLAYYVVFWSMAREVIISLARKFARSYGIKKEGKLQRFGEQVHAVVYWGIFGAWGFYIMSELPTWWYNTDAFWTTYPHWDMNPMLKRYYLMQIAFWAQQLIVLGLCLEKPRLDYKELVCHHLVTIWLVGWSYLMNLTLIGNAVYMSMDIPDAFFAFSKCLNYLQFDRAKVVSLAFFVVVWTYFRHYLNFIILWSVWYEADHIPEWTRQWNPELGVWMPWWLKYQIFVPLAALQGLNLFWYYLIMRVLLRALTRSEVTDIRSDDEDDEDETPSRPKED